VVKAFFNFSKLALAFKVKVKGLIFFLFFISTKRLVSLIGIPINKPLIKVSKT
jgi:hypothetical protein